MMHEITRRLRARITRDERAYGDTGGELLEERAAGEGGDAERHGVFAKEVGGYWQER